MLLFGLMDTYLHLAYSLILVLLAVHFNQGEVIYVTPSKGHICSEQLCLLSQSLQTIVT